MTAFSSVERGAAVFPHAFTARPLENVTRSVDDELEDLEKMLNELHFAAIGHGDADASCQSVATFTPVSSAQAILESY